MENWLSKRAYLSPDAPAVQYGSQELTFKELQVAVLALAGKLVNVLDGNQRVGLLTRNNLMGYELILALQQLGRQIVLLNSRLADDELAYQISDANLSQVLVDDQLQYQLAVEQLSFTTIKNTQGKTVEPVVEFDNDQVTTIMYTSGTTGKPKGVLQTFGNHFYSAMGSVLNLGLTDQEAWLAVVPIFHISGLSIMMRSLLYGMKVVLVEKFSATDINHLLLDGQATIMSVVPTMLTALQADLSLGQRYPKHFRTFLVGGGPIDRTDLEHAQASGATIVQSYGMTETASQVVALDPKDAVKKIGSVGKPLFPVSLRIKTNDTSVNAVGRVQLKSPTLTAGYLNQTKKYLASFDEGWFDTGDWGYLDSEGYLYIVGREGDMISSGGENVFPDEVEAVYRALPEVDEVAVLGEKNQEWGQVPVAIIRFKAAASLSSEALRAYGRQHLAHYKVPQTFYLDQGTAFPRTASGKLQRYQLAKVLASFDLLP